VSKRRTPTIEVHDLTDDGAGQWWILGIANRLVERLKSQRYGSKGGKAKAASKAEKDKRQAKQELLVQAKKLYATGHSRKDADWTLAEDPAFTRHWTERTIYNHLAVVYGKGRRDE
jgi:hypothetical protein